MRDPVRKAGNMKRTKYHAGAQPSPFRPPHLHSYNPPHPPQPASGLVQISVSRRKTAGEFLICKTAVCSACGCLRPDAWPRAEVFLKL